MTPACKWLKTHEETAHALSRVFVIVSLDLPRLRRNGHPRFAHQLLTGFIEAHLWIPGIIGTDVDIQYLFHLTDKSGIGLGRNAILFFLPRLEFVFFNTFRTVSRPTRPTYPSSTILSSSRRIVQCTCPHGPVSHASPPNWPPPLPS